MCIDPFVNYTQILEPPKLIFFFSSNRILLGFHVCSIRHQKEILDDLAFHDAQVSLG